MSSAVWYFILSLLLMAVWDGDWKTDQIIEDEWPI